MFERLDYTPVAVDFNAWLEAMRYEPLPFEVKLVALETDWCDEPQKTAWEYFTRACVIAPDSLNVAGIKDFAARIEGFNQESAKVWENRINAALQEGVKWNGKQV